MNFKKIIAAVLTVSIIVFTLLAVLSIWDVLDEDVAWRSAATLGVICIAAILGLLAIRIVDSNK